MKKRMLVGCAALAGSLWGGASVARAQSYFNITAVGSGGTVVMAHGSNIITLVDNLVNGNSQFAPLIGQNFTAALGYGGVPNSLIFTENLTQTNVTLTIPATGFTKTFVGMNASDVQTQIKDFIKSNESGAYAAFTRSIDNTSPVAAVDGNPQSFTEFLMTDAYERFGFDSTLSKESMESTPADQASNGGIRVDLTGGGSRAGGLSGSFAELSLGADVRFNDTVALSFGTAVQFRSVSSAETYFIGQEVGLPITIINQEDQDGFAWQVTPWGFAGIGASIDQVDGAVLVGGGGTSCLNYTLSEFTFTLADQVSYASGLNVNYGSYALGTDVSQWVLKNGGKVSYDTGKALFVEGGLSYSTLLNHGAVPDFWTPEFGVGIKFGKYTGLKTDFEANLASRYTDLDGKLTFFMAY